MEFKKQNIIDFLNVALQTIPGEVCGNQAREINRLPKLYGDLTVEASVGIGRTTAIPWISFLGYGQETSNGIYPVILYYHRLKILIVAFGVSATEAPERSWCGLGVPTLGQYFIEKNITLNGREKNYNSSFVHSVFDVPILSNELDTSRFDIDKVFTSLNDVCKKYKELFESSISSTAYTHGDFNYKKASDFITSEVPSEVEKGLLELIVNFRLQKDVCFADILGAMEKVEFSPEKKECRQPVDDALRRKIKRKLDELIRRIAKIENEEQYNNMDDPNSLLNRMRRAAKKVKELLDEVSREGVVLVKPLGEFVHRDNPKVVIYYKNIESVCNSMSCERWEIMAGVFVHEMFHAWNYFRAGKKSRSVLAIDEPMVEFETLYFLKKLEAFTDSDSTYHDQVSRVSQKRKDIVQDKQLSIGDVAAYGFGYYLFEKLGKSDYESIKWIETYSKKSAFVSALVDDSGSVEKAEKALIPIYPFMSEADVMKLFRKIIFDGRVPFETAFPTVKTGLPISLHDLVLACIEAIGRKYFEAKELYAFAPIFKLCAAVPGNLEDALKKQLDELVKDGVLEAFSHDCYVVK